MFWENWSRVPPSLFVREEIHKIIFRCLRSSYLSQRNSAPFLLSTLTRHQKMCRWRGLGRFSRSLIDGEKLHGTITVTDGQSSQSIYNRDWENLQGIECSATHRCYAGFGEDCNLSLSLSIYIYIYIFNLYLNLPLLTGSFHILYSSSSSSITIFPILKNFTSKCLQRLYIHDVYLKYIFMN